MTVGTVQLQIGGLFEWLFDGNIVSLDETLTFFAIVKFRLENLHYMEITLFSSKTKASLA